MSVGLNNWAAEVVSDEPLVIKNVKNWFHSHTYGGWGRFFRGLQESKLLATRCVNPKCGERRLWLPPRCQCPDCWHDMQWVEAPTIGEIYTHTTVQYPGALFHATAPCPLISVSIDGVCTKLMSYLKEGTPRIGLPVRAVFHTSKPTHTILDLAWVPR